MMYLLIKILFILLITEKTYCDGWEKGYVKGYCYEEITCIKPIVPICPVPKPNFTEYQDGYDRGFTAGKKAKS